MMSGLILLVVRLALALVIYVFLAWVLLILWRGLKDQDKPKPISPFPTITLNLESEGSWVPFRYTGAEVVIGRDPTCGCVLDDATVSARHARLSYHHNQWWVEDLDSRNGTFLNNEPAIDALVLASGDQLRCGQVVFQVLVGVD